MGRPKGAVALPVTAATQWCDGKIAHTFADRSGGVYIFGTWRNDWQQICNLNFVWKEISVSSCRAWFSTSQTAVVTQQPVIVSIDTTSCATMPTYGESPSPIYLMLRSAL